MAFLCWKFLDFENFSLAAGSLASEGPHLLQQQTFYILPYRLYSCCSTRWFIIGRSLN